MKASRERILCAVLSKGEKSPDSDMNRNRAEKSIPDLPTGRRVLPNISPDDEVGRGLCVAIFSGPKLHPLVGAVM